MYLHIGHPTDGNRQSVTSFFSKQTYLKNEEICCITNKGKVAKNEWKNDDSDFLQAFYRVYKKLGCNSFFILTC